MGNVVVTDQDDYYDGYKNVKGAITVQCRTCGTVMHTLTEITADFWIEVGCPSCQKRYTAIAVKLLTDAGFTDEGLWPAL